MPLAHLIEPVRFDPFDPPSIPVEHIREAEFVARECEQALTPATRHEAGEILMRLRVALRAEKRAPEEWRVLTEDMLEDLASVPAWALHAAAREWRKHNVFFPTSAELLELAGREMAPVHSIRKAAKQVAEYTNPAPKQRMTQERMDEIKAEVRAANQREAYGT